MGVIKGKHGDFLVRESSHADKFILCVNDKGKSCCFPIEVTLDRKYVIGSATFETLQTAIDSLRAEGLKRKTGKPIKLRSPAAGGTELIITQIVDETLETD